MIRIIQDLLFWTVHNDIIAYWRREYWEGGREVGMRGTCPSLFSRLLKWRDRGTEWLRLRLRIARTVSQTGDGRSGRRLGRGKVKSEEEGKVRGGLTLEWEGWGEWGSEERKRGLKGGASWARYCWWEGSNLASGQTCQAADASSRRARLPADCPLLQCPTTYQ